MSPLTFDIILFLIVALSTVLGFFRGFTREFFGTLGWLGAIIITIFAYYPVQPLLAPYIKITWLLHVATTLILFLPSYIILRLISAWLSEHVKKSFLKSLDRTLGAFWGIARGVVLSCVIFIVLVAVSPKTVTSFEEAKTLPWAKSLSLGLINLLPANFDGMSLQKHLISPPQPSSDKRAELLSSMSPQSAIAPLKHKPNIPYADRERQSLNQLIKDRART